MTNDTLLAHLNPSLESPLTTDKSEHVIGTVLQQRRNDHFELIAFCSKKFTTTQQKYSDYDRLERQTDTGESSQGKM